MGKQNKQTTKTLFEEIPFLSENPKLNQPDYCFRNGSSWQHVKAISWFHRDLQFGLQHSSRPCWPTRPTHPVE